MSEVDIVFGAVAVLDDHLVHVEVASCYIELELVESAVLCTYFDDIFVESVVYLFRTELFPRDKS